MKKIIVSNLIPCDTIKVYKRHVDDTLLLTKPSQIPVVLAIFNELDKNLNFTVDTSLDGVIHFLDIKISLDGTDVYPKNSPTGQHTHLFSFDTFARNYFSIAHLWSAAIKSFLTNKSTPWNVSCRGMVFPI